MKKKNLQFKKWLYFTILYIACGLTGYHIYRYLQTNDFYILFSAAAMLLLAIGSFIQWKFIVKILNTQSKY